MSSVVLLPLLILGGVFVISVLIGVILLVAFKARPQQPGWVPATAATDPAPGAPWPAPGTVPFVGVWNAEILGGHGLGIGGRTFGTFRLEAGVLSFTPDQAAVPAWAFPCRQLAVARRQFFALDGADVRLLGPMGEVLCSVSTERINRWSQNTVKDLRERQYAEHFVALLHGHGAGLAT